MTGKISQIQRFSLGDGPGIRTTLFLKGCPLHCPWCHNPETIPSKPLLMLYLSICTSCGKCALVCQNAAHGFTEAGEHVIDRNACIACGKCVDECSHRAIEINGKEMSVEELMKIIKEDEDFYIASDGGVTLSGGEPLMQGEFAIQIAKACKENNIDVLIDTSAQASIDILKGIRQYADKFYIDLKAATDEDYKSVTGGSLRKVLDAIAYLVNSHADVTVRIPVIPEHNQSIEYMEKMAQLLRPTGVKKVDLLPFHSLCKSKYDALGLKFKYSDTESLTKESISCLLDAFKGFDARITN